MLLTLVGMRIKLLLNPKLKDWKELIKTRKTIRKTRGKMVRIQAKMARHLENEGISWVSSDQLIRISKQNKV